MGKKYIGWICLCVSLLLNAKLTISIGIALVITILFAVNNIDIDTDDFVHIGSMSTEDIEEKGNELFIVVAMLIMMIASTYNIITIL